MTTRHNHVLCIIAPFDEDKVFDFVISIAGGPNNPETEIPKIAHWLQESALL